MPLCLIEPQVCQVRLAQVRGRHRIIILGGTVKLVTATCSSHLSEHVVSALIEPFEQDRSCAGILILPAMVTVSKGTVEVLVVNADETDVVLQPH